MNLELGLEVEEEMYSEAKDVSLPVDELTGVTGLEVPADDGEGNCIRSGAVINKLARSA